MPLRVQDEGWRNGLFKDSQDVLWLGGRGPRIIQEIHNTVMMNKVKGHEEGQEGRSLERSIETSLEMKLER